jgi:hypothetical protein
MPTLKRAPAISDDLLVLIDSRLAGLKRYRGPELRIHALSSQRPGEVILLAWLPEKDAIETEQPRFGAKGLPHQVTGALQQWFQHEGWIQRER